MAVMLERAVGVDVTVDVYEVMAVNVTEGLAVYKWQAEVSRDRTP